MKVFHAEKKFRLQNSTELDGQWERGSETAISTREWAEQEHGANGSCAGNDCLICLTNEFGVSRNENNRVPNTGACA